MSNQPGSSSTSAPTTPSSSNQGKTQVFILTPDILKKLGIASKIPSLTSASSIGNVSTTQITKIDINLEHSMKNKLALALNKKINVKKNVVETKICDNVTDKIKQNENEEDSVKTKLLSMLTSKLEKEKSTSCSLESTTDKKTTDFKNRIKPNESVNETKLLQNSLQLEESKVEKRETDSEINELDKNYIKTKLTEINTKHDIVQNINDSIKNIQSTKITQSTKPIPTNELIETNADPSLPSTSLLKNILSRESTIKIDNKKNISNVVNRTVSKENKDNMDAQKYIKHDNTESKPISKGRKRKITEESPTEDPDLISPIRKSGRKRKLSTLHTDYVTELKLHDGSGKKLSNRTRKSIDMKFTENENEHVTGDSNDLNENNNINASTNESQNLKPNNETEKVTEIHEKNKKVNIETNENLVPEINVINISLESSLNGRILANNESNNNAEQQLTTDTKSNPYKDNNTICANVLSSPKKQIIIHENILIKSPISSIQNETKNLENVKKSLIENLSQIDAVDSSGTKITGFVINKDLIENKPEIVPTLDLKVKPPLKTYSGKIKARLSTETEQKAESQIVSSEVNQSISDIKVVAPIKNMSLDSSVTNSETNKNAETKPDTKTSTAIKTKSDPSKIDTPSNPTETLNSSKQETKQEIKSPETIVLVRRRRSRPGKDNSAASTTTLSQKINSANLVEFETFFSSALTTETNASPSTTQENTKQNLVTDNTAMQVTIPIRRLPEQTKNTEDPDKKTESETFESMIDTTETKTARTTEDPNKRQKILPDLETIASETTAIHSREREIQQNKAESESVESPIDTIITNTTLTTEDVNEKQKILIDTETNATETTAIHSQKRIVKLNENESEPETTESLIDTKEANTTVTIVDVNEKQKILTDSETNATQTTAIDRIHLVQQNKNKDSASETVASPIITTEIKSSESIQKVNILTDSETKSPVSTPVRRKGRPPKQNNTDSKPETIDSPTVTTKTIDNQLFETSHIDQEEPTECITPIRRRGRPRKEKKILQDSEAENSPIVTNESIEQVTDTESTPAPKRGRGRRKKNITVEEIQEKKIETPTTKNGEKYIKIPGRGRRKATVEIEEDHSNKSIEVTCAVCNEIVERIHWITHCIKHNFLCWQVGEPAINLDDRKLVEYLLHKALKENPRFKHFTCPSCADKKKSVLGFLSHIEMCQLSDEARLAMMEACNVCNKKVMPQSMKSHMKTHDDYMKRGGIDTEGQLEDDLLAPRTKRKAAAKAANLIQEVTTEEDVLTVVKKEEKLGKKNYKKASDPGSVFMTFGVIKKIQVPFNKGARKCKFKNCKFECDDFADMKIHLNSCPTIEPDDYICRYCLFVEKNENAMKDHVNNKHLAQKEDYKSDVSGSGDSDEDDYGDNEIILSGDETNSSLAITGKKLTKPSTEYIRTTFKIGFLARERRIIRDPVCSYVPALKWTYEFCRENYNDVLFENIKCLSSKWTPMSLNEQEKYVPLLKKSMSVKTCSIALKIPNHQKQKHEWKEYDLYESSLENDTATIFCGGPIWALAWVPTPLSLISDQYLAVSLQKDFEAHYKISESPSGQEVIQFWNFGPLECNVPLDGLPTLEFSIAHNHGMVWCMEWCASGYYDEDDLDTSDELRKLGLLALACSDGNIPIYAIGIPKDEELNKNNIYNIKPAFKLILQQPLEHLLGQWNYQVTKISWSKSSGHNIISGGYSNGIVCLWDLENTSPLLRSEENDVVILRPYQSFQAHTSAISALVLYPLVDEGKRWLLTGSWDRTFKYWDLNNTASPVSTFGKRGIITDGVWISHWLCSFFAYDDVFSLGHTITTVQNPRDFGFKQCSALASNSVVMSLSASDWASAIAQGTLAGELTTTFPRTILISYDVDKHLKCKRMMLSYNEIIDKTKDPSERKDIMKTEKKPEKLDNERDDKLFSQYFDSKDSEPYVEEPSTYEKAREKYGMLFCDFKLTHFSLLPHESLEAVKQSSRLREVPAELYPFTSLNRLVWNPNKQAYLYVASGYQNGFVRLRCVRLMNSP